MRTTFIQLFFGSLFFAGIFLLLNFWYVRTIRPESILERQFDWISQPILQPHTVLLGDSHTAFGLFFESRPDSFFNFSSPGDEITDFLVKTDWLLNNKTQVETVIIQLDPHNFFTYSEESPSNGRGAYLSKISLKSFQHLHGLDAWTVRKWQTEALFPIFKPEIRLLVKTRMIKKIDEAVSGRPFIVSSKMDSVGNITWQTGNKSMAGYDSSEIAVFVKRKVTQVHKMPLGMQETRINEFKELVKMWKGAGRHVVGIKMPLMKEYREQAKPFLKTNIDSMALSSGVDMIWDFSEWGDADASLFCDPNHLSLKGAKAFTPQFLDNLNNRSKNKGTISNR